MAYCMECGKMTEDGQIYCAEHSNSNRQSQQNMSCFTDEAQQTVNNSVPVNNTNFAPQPVYTGNYPYTAPAKKAPLWMFPVFAFISTLLGDIFSTISNYVMTAIADNSSFIDFNYAMLISRGGILSVIVFFICIAACLVLYNKTCKKNGLENSVFPVYYCGIFYICSALCSIVRIIFSNIVYIILGIVSENTYLPFEYYEAYSVINIITGFIYYIAFVLITFVAFSYIHKKQTEK